MDDQIPVTQIWSSVNHLDNDLIEMVTYYIPPDSLEYYLDRLKNGLGPRFTQLNFLRTDHFSKSVSSKLLENTANMKDQADSDICYFYHQYLWIHQLDDFIIDPLVGLEWSILHGYHQLAKLFFHYHLYLTNKYPALRLNSNLAPIWRLALIHQENEILELFDQNYEFSDEYKEKECSQDLLPDWTNTNHYFLFISTLHRGFAVLEDINSEPIVPSITKGEDQLDITAKLSIKLLRLNGIDTKEKLFKSKEILAALLLIDPKRAMELTKEWDRYLDMTVKIVAIKADLEILKETLPKYIELKSTKFKTSRINYSDSTNSIDPNFDYNVYSSDEEKEIDLNFLHTRGLESLLMIASRFHQDLGVRDYLQQLIMHHRRLAQIEDTIEIILPMGCFELDHLQSNLKGHPIMSPVYQKLLLGVLFQEIHLQEQDELSLQLNVEQYHRLHHWIERPRAFACQIVNLTNLEYIVISSLQKGDLTESFNAYLQIVAATGLTHTPAFRNPFQLVANLIRLTPYQYDSNAYELLARIITKSDHKTQFWMLGQAVKQSKFKLLAFLLEAITPGITFEVSYSFISQWTSLSTQGNLYQTAYIIGLLEKHFNFFEAPLLDQISVQTDKLTQIHEILLRCSNLIKSTLKSDHAASIIAYWCEKFSASTGVSSLPTLVIIDRYLPKIRESIDPTLNNAIEYLLDVYRYRKRINQMEVFKETSSRLSQFPFSYKINVSLLLPMLTELFKIGDDKQGNSK